MPFRSEKPNMEVSKAAAIGISLTTSYGTISLRNDDGSFVDIGRLDGDPKYLQMMERLSSYDSAHPSPPYRNAEEMWNDIPRQVWRSTRKRLGLPASSDVAVLSEIIKELCQVCSSHILPKDSSVVVSYPSLNALYEEDISDALKYLNFRAPKGHHIYQPREITAAYAGHGMGLCESYENREKCRTEGLKLPARETLSVEFTKNSIILHCATMRQAIDLANPDIDIISTFVRSADENWPDYDERLRILLMRLLQQRYRYLGVPKMLTIIMTGESAGNKDWQKAIIAIVEDFGCKAILLASNPEFTAARGAAELAWRAEW